MNVGKLMSLTTTTVKEAEARDHFRPRGRVHRECPQSKRKHRPAQLMGVLHPHRLHHGRRSNIASLPLDWN